MAKATCIDPVKLLHANDQPGIHAASWYRDSCAAPARPALLTNIDTDTCIIGAGFTGLSAALELAKLGKACVVLDAHRVGWGASGRNGGQLGTGFNVNQQKLEAMLGHSTARELWNISEQAKSWILDLCTSTGTDIEYCPGIVHAMHRKRFVSALHAYCEYLQKHYGYDAMQPLDLHAIRSRVASANYYGGVIDQGAGHINPLKLSHCIASAAENAGAVILERSQAIGIQTPTAGGSQRVVTATGSVSCRNILLATNGYLDDLEPRLCSRLMPINNFIVVTEPLGARATELLPFNEAVADSRFVVNYFRRVDDDRLLFGGGENYSYRFPRPIAPLVRKAMLDVFPQLHDAAIDYAWGGTLAITRNRLPFLGEIKPRMYTAGGYSGHGVALACICGKALADKLAGDTRLFDTLSRLPNRPFPGGTKSRPALLALAMTGYSWLDRF